MTITAKEGVSILDTRCMDTFGASEHFVESSARTSHHYDSLSDRLDAHHLEQPIADNVEEEAEEEEEKDLFTTQYEASTESSYTEEDQIPFQEGESEEEFTGTVYEQDKQTMYHQAQNPAPKSGAWTFQGNDSSDPWDEGYGYEDSSHVYSGYPIDDDPYSYGVPAGARRYYSPVSTGRPLTKDRYMENVNPALSMLVAGALTIVSKNMKKHLEDINGETVVVETTSSGSGGGVNSAYVSRLSTPNRFNAACQKIQRGSEEDLEYVYESIFEHWALLKPLCTRDAMERGVRELALGLEDGNIAVAKGAMDELCRSVHLSDSSVNTMKRLVEQMHRAVARYRCSQCKDMKQFKVCVIHANEMVVTTTNPTTYL